MEKEMATHSSTLAWKILWTEDPGGLQSHGAAKSQTQLSNFAHSHRMDFCVIISIIFILFFLYNHHLF